MLIRRVALISSQSRLDSVRCGRSSVLHDAGYTRRRGSGSLHGHVISIDGTLGPLDRSINVMASIITDKVGQIVHSSRTSVLDRLSLPARFEEFDGREALDLFGNVVERGVNLGDRDLVSVALVHLRELLVFGRESFAVAAPGGVELDEHVFLVIDDDVLVALRDHDCHGGFLFLRDRLALDAGFDFACDEVRNKFANVLLAEGFSVTLCAVRVFGVLLHVLDGERRPLADLEIEVAAVLTEVLRIDRGEVDGAFVLLSHGFEGCGERSALFFGLGKDVREWSVGLVESSATSLKCTCTISRSDLPPCIQHMSQAQPLQSEAWKPFE